MALNHTAVVKPLSDTASSLAAKETLAYAWQLVIVDKVATWRLANIAKHQAKFNTRVADRGLKPNMVRIPERFTARCIEEASKQDDDEIQDLFANFLANAITGLSSHIGVSPHNKLHQDPYNVSSSRLYRDRGKDVVR